MTQENPPRESETEIETLKDIRELPLDATEQQKIKEIKEKATEMPSGLSSKDQADIDAIKASMPVVIAKIQQEMPSGAESFKDERHANEKGRPWFQKVAALFSLGITAVVAPKISHAKTAEETFSKDTAKTSVSTDAEDSLSAKKNTAEIKTGSKITWLESDMEANGLKVEARAIIPFSDTAKRVEILKFDNGDVAQMIEAAQKLGYKTLSAEDFVKMYQENQASANQLKQTFSAEVINDRNDTDPNSYNTYQNEDIGGGIKKETIVIGAKSTHTAYPYIGLTGKLTRFEKDQNLNSDAGIAVYK